MKIEIFKSTTPIDTSFLHVFAQSSVRESIGQYRQDAQYAALDENAAIWVLATLIDYEMVMYELFVRDLSSGEWKIAKSIVERVQRRKKRIISFIERFVVFGALTDRCYRRPTKNSWITVGKYGTFQC